MNRQFKGVWISKEIWLDKNLTWMEKLFLTEINSLDGDNGCFASNNYFAEFFNVTGSRASQIISALVKKNYVSSYLQKDGKRVKKRVLRILNDPIKYSKEGTKYSKGGTKYSKGGYLEYCEGINTNINNTVNNTVNNTKNNIKDAATKKSVAAFSEENKKPRSDTGSMHKEIIDTFHTAYLQKTKMKPGWGKVEGNMIKTLLKKHDKDEIKKKIKYFFEGDHWFTKGGNYSLKTFIARYDDITGYGKKSPIQEMIERYS